MGQDAIMGIGMITAAFTAVGVAWGASKVVKNLFTRGNFEGTEKTIMRGIKGGRPPR